MKKLIILCILLCTNLFAHTIALDSSIEGEWTTNSAVSPYWAESYTEDYSFTLTQKTLIFSCLTNYADTYLTLTNSENNILRSNDDYYESEYSNDACIRIALEAGVYTLHASNGDVTYNSNNDPIYHTGAFTLDLKDLPMAASSPINIGDTVDTAWTDASGYTTQSYGGLSHLYTFSVTEKTIVKIKLLAAEGEAALYLLNAEGKKLEGSAGKPSGEGGEVIRRKLAPGNYTIDAASSIYTPYEDNYTLVLTELILPSPVPVAIALDQSLEGQWSSAFGYSSQQIEHYARYYTFTLTESTLIEVEVSSDIPSSIYMMDHAQSVVGSSAYPKQNYTLIIYLDAGTYTIDTTSPWSYYDQHEGVEGDFNISLREANAPTLNEIDLNSKLSGEWSKNSGFSVNTTRRASHYRFTLDKTTNVRMELNPDIPAYMFLLDSNQNVLLPKKYAPDSKTGIIYATLDAGTYIIETTTNSSYDGCYYSCGRFTIGVYEDFTTPKPVKTVSISSVKAHEANIEWSHGTHDAIGYEIYIDNILYATIKSNGIRDFTYSYTIGGLLPNHHYNYEVVAYTGVGKSTAKKGSFRTKEGFYGWMIPINYLLL